MSWNLSQKTAEPQRSNIKARFIIGNQLKFWCLLIMERYLLSGRSVPSRWQLSHQTLASCTQSALVYSILDIQKTIFIVFSSNCSFNWWFNERPVLLTDLWGYQQEYMTANNSFLVKKAWPQRIISKIVLIK